MSWLVVALVTLAYWLLLFVRMRVRGRMQFDRAFDAAAAAHRDEDRFEVTVSSEVRPLRVAAVVLVVPAILLLIRFLLARGAP